MALIDLDSRGEGHPQPADRRCLSRSSRLHCHSLSRAVSARTPPSPFTPWPPRPRRARPKQKAERLQAEDGRAQASVLPEPLLAQAAARVPREADEEAEGAEAGAHALPAQRRPATGSAGSPGAAGSARASRTRHDAARAHDPVAGRAGVVHGLDRHRERHRAGSRQRHRGPGVQHPAGGSQRGFLHLPGRAQRGIEHDRRHGLGYSGEHVRYERRCEPRAGRRGRGSGSERARLGGGRRPGPAARRRAGVGHP